jgi:hypothetical protein
MTALWNEVCLAFPSLDAMRDGYEVYRVVDAVGGTSPEAHRAGLERMLQAGAQPISWVSLACELQRDWAREETVADVVDIVLTSGCSRLAKRSVSRTRFGGFDETAVSCAGPSTFSRFARQVETGHDRVAGVPRTARSPARSPRRRG